MKKKILNFLKDLPMMIVTGIIYIVILALMYIIQNPMKQKAINFIKELPMMIASGIIYIIILALMYSPIAALVYLIYQRLNSN